MKRVWLVKVHQSWYGGGAWTGAVDSFLPDWYATKGEASKALRGYRSECEVDCPMSVERFDLARPRKGNKP